MSLEIQFYPENCLRGIHRSSKCFLCFDVCPTQAIDFRGTTPRLDALKCVNCGACTSVCPTDVFEAKNPTDEEIIRFIEDKKKEKSHEIVFACERIQTKKSHFIEVPCLARFDVSLLLFCLTQTPITIQLIHGKCEKCYASCIEEIFAKRVHHAKNILDMFFSKSDIHLCHLNEYEEKKDQKIDGITKDGHMRRRMFLTLLGKKPSSQEAEILTLQRPIVFQDNIYQKHSFKKHRRLMHVIEQIRHNFFYESHPTIIGGKPIIDSQKCKECSICTKVCPTGALGIKEENEFCIDFTSNECIECHMCEDVCFAKAISFAPKTIDDVLKNNPVNLFFHEVINQNESHKVVIFRT